MHGSKKGFELFNAILSLSISPRGGSGRREKGNTKFGREFLEGAGLCNAAFSITAEGAGGHIGMNDVCKEAVLYGTS